MTRAEMEAECRRLIEELLTSGKADALIHAHVSKELARRRIRLAGKIVPQSGSPPTRA